MIKLANGRYAPLSSGVFSRRSDEPLRNSRGFLCVSVPDGVAGGVGVVGGHPPDGGAHPGVFQHHHPGERRGEDGRLVHVLHRHLDGGGVAEGAQAQEVGVDVPVGGFQPEREAALGLEVQRLQGTEGDRGGVSRGELTAVSDAATGGLPLVAVILRV